MVEPSLSQVERNLLHRFRFGEGVPRNSPDMPAINRLQRRGLVNAKPTERPDVPGQWWIMVTWTDLATQEMKRKSGQ